jgi:hypothetical protein
MARKKTIWGGPGETGVTKDGIPWAVPLTGPGRGAKIFYALFPGGGVYMPAGAKFVPAQTAAEMQERLTRKFGQGITKLLDEDEHLVGFADFLIDENVPQPPRIGIEAKIGPSRRKHWRMGGGWDTAAGQLIMRIGGSRGHRGILPRDELLIRTDRRVMIWRGNMERPAWIDAEYGLNQIGIRPDWQPIDRSSLDDRWRVDIAFPDGSWIGVNGASGHVPGGSEFPAGRDLLAELAGPPVAAYPLPALGRQ